MKNRTALIYNQNLKITQLAKCGRIAEAARVFDGMAQRNTVTFNAMISAYAKNGRVAEARRLFDTMPSRNLISWNTMIAGYLHNDSVLDAWDLFEKMPKRDVFSWTIMITCYARNGELDVARMLFDRMREGKSSACYNAMIAGYAKNRCFKNARLLLGEMPVPDMVSWNSVLAGYTHNEEMGMASEFFHEMPNRDVVSWNLMVDGFVRVSDLDSAWDFFRRIPCPNVVSWVTMLNGYSKNGQVAEARRLFNRMPERNIVSWNAMISAYVQALQIQEAYQTFMEMPQRNSVSWTAMISGFVRVGKLDKARELLNQMPYKNVAAQTAMLSGYVQSMRMVEAKHIFEQIDSRDTVCWNTMISGCAHCGRMDEAMNLFRQMPKKDGVSWNTMIAGYAQEGKMAEAKEIFEQMHERNIVSWNSIISGFTQNGFYIEALSYFLLMRREGKKPDWSTFTCALSACANLAALQVGKQLNSLVLRSGYLNDLFAGNALINMYAKCGKILRAKQVFCEMVSVDIISWNSLISGFALNGYGRGAVMLFQEMVRQGFVPDEITFIGVLSACSHAGLIDEGLSFFRSITREYSVDLVAEHYACVVDLLGRVGRVEEAYELVKGMAIKPNAAIWGTLLGACRIHRNAGIASFAADKLLEFEPHKTSNYVTLSNVHAEAGRWDVVERLRFLMKEKKVQKEPGHSWIELKNQVHAFTADDSTEPRATDLCRLLETLTEQMQITMQIPYFTSIADYG